MPDAIIITACACITGIGLGYLIGGVVIAWRENKPKKGAGKMNQKGFTMLELLVIVMFVFGLFGEVMCVVKCVRSDFEPPYKREIIYGAAALTGLGAIVGYFDIKDGR